MSIGMQGRLACLAVVTSVAAGHPGSVSAARPGTTTAVALRVTVEPIDSAGNQCRICSDGGGEYVDGVDAVRATLDQYGNFIVDFGRTNHEVRELTFDYSQPVDPANSYPTPAVQRGSYLSTVDGNPSLFLQNLPIGSEACVGLQISFEDGDDLFHANRFRRYVSDTSESSFLVVTRMDANTWEAEPKPATCNTGAATPYVGTLATSPAIIGEPYTNRGDFHLNFKMTLRRR